MMEALRSNPRRVFLIDSGGALLTAFMLGFVLLRLESYIGMPAHVLIPLAIVAGLFSVYSISCYFFIEKHWRAFLKSIAIANLLYCCLTSVLIILYYDSLTVLGIAYFIAEIIVVVTLAIFEIAVTVSKE